MIAGTLHDIAKEFDLKKAEVLLKKFAPNKLSEPIPVWHSYVGSIYLKQTWNINDNEILSAVFKHTTGDKEMSLFDMIIFCADKVSFERNYDNVKYFRKQVLKNLTTGFKKLVKLQYDVAVKKHGEKNIGNDLAKTYEYWGKDN